MAASGGSRTNSGKAPVQMGQSDVDDGANMSITQFSERISAQMKQVPADIKRLDESLTGVHVVLEELDRRVDKRVLEVEQECTRQADALKAVDTRVQDVESFMDAIPAWKEESIARMEEGQQKQRQETRELQNALDSHKADFEGKALDTASRISALEEMAVRAAAEQARQAEQISELRELHAAVAGESEQLQQQLSEACETIVKQTTRLHEARLAANTASRRIQDLETLVTSLQSQADALREQSQSHAEILQPLQARCSGLQLLVEDQTRLGSVTQQRLAALEQLDCDDRLVQAMSKIQRLEDLQQESQKQQQEETARVEKAVRDVEVTVAMEPPAVGRLRSQCKAAVATATEQQKAMDGLHLEMKRVREAAKVAGARYEELQGAVEALQSESLGLRINIEHHVRKAVSVSGLAESSRTVQQQQEPALRDADAMLHRFVEAQGEAVRQLQERLALLEEATAAPTQEHNLHYAPAPADGTKAGPLAPAAQPTERPPEGAAEAATAAAAAELASAGGNGALSGAVPTSSEEAAAAATVAAAAVPADAGSAAQEAGGAAGGGGGGGSPLEPAAAGSREAAAAATAPTAAEQGGDGGGSASSRSGGGNAAGGGRRRMDLQRVAKGGRVSGGVELHRLIQDLSLAVLQEMEAFGVSVGEDAGTGEADVAEEVRRHRQLLGLANRSLARLVRSDAQTAADFLVVFAVLADVRLVTVEAGVGVLQQQMASAFTNLQNAFDYLGKLQKAVDGKAPLAALDMLTEKVESFGLSVAARPGTAEQQKSSKPPTTPASGTAAAAGALQHPAMDSSSAGDAAATSRKQRSNSRSFPSSQVAPGATPQQAPHPPSTGLMHVVTSGPDVFMPMATMPPPQYMRAHRDLAAEQQRTLQNAQKTQVM